MVRYTLKDTNVLTHRRKVIATIDAVNDHDAWLNVYEFARGRKINFTVYVGPTHVGNIDWKHV